MIRSVKTLLLALVVVAVAACSGTEEPTIDSGALDASPEATTDDGTVVDDELGTTDEASPSPTPEADASPVAVDASLAPTFDEVCAGRDDEAFIEVLTPQPDTEVSDPITVTGCGNTFEATYLYRLETEDGTVLVEDFGTMSCGNGCVGEFTVELAAGTTGDVVLVVYETSAEDGSAQNVVEVPLTVG